MAVVLPLLEKQKDSLGKEVFAALTHAAKQEIAEARVMKAVYESSAQFAVRDFPDDLTNFVLLTYCGRLMSDISQSKACVLSSKGALDIREVEGLVVGASRAMRGKSIREKVYKTLAKILATPYFVEEDVERTSLVLKLAGKKKRLAGLYKSLLCAYNGVLYKRAGHKTGGTLDCDVPDPKSLLKLPAFVQKLIFERRPNSVLPHVDAAVECLSHALLLLKRSETKVTYPVNLTYAQLWDIPGDVAEKSLATYFWSRFSSAMDMHSRSNSLRSYNRHANLVLQYVTKEDIPEEERSGLVPAELQLIEMMKPTVLCAAKSDMRVARKIRGIAEAQAVRYTIRCRLYLSEPLEYQKLYDIPVPALPVSSEAADYPASSADDSSDDDDHTSSSDDDGQPAKRRKV